MDFVLFEVQKPVDRNAVIQLGGRLDTFSTFLPRLGIAIIAVIGGFTCKRGERGNSLYRSFVRGSEQKNI